MSPLDSSLIPLPLSAIDERAIQPADPNDLLGSLFTGEDAIFQSQQAHGERRGTSSSLHSDFGAFVSVPTPEEAKEHPLIDFGEHDTQSPAPEVKPRVSDFFDQITEEARKHTEENRKRVVNQISDHEEDPLLWLKPSDRSTFTPFSINEQEQQRQQQSLSSYPRSDYMVHPQAGILSQTFPERAHTWETSTARNNAHSDNLSTTMLPRKWMSSLLSTSVPSLPYTLKHSPSSAPPKQRSMPPPVTHASPFAPHTFVPPSGAPGFAGDNSWNKTGFVFDENDHHLRRLRLEGRKESTTPILGLELAEEIRTNLPPLPKLAKSWTLLYSLDQHGVSLQTLYTRCASKVSSTLVAIQDSEDSVFGVWLGGTIHLSSGYYGTGDSFLWSSRDQRNVQTFKWTGKNDYVALCEKGFISFGGGTGKYGLYLSENLTDGSSASCPTFDNPVLSGSGRHEANNDMTMNFECVGVEIWGISN